MTPYTQCEYDFFTPHTHQAQGRADNPKQNSTTTSMWLPILCCPNPPGLVFQCCSSKISINKPPCTNELGWRVRTGIKVMKWKGVRPEEAIHVKILQAGCGQEGYYVSEIRDRKLPLNKSPVIAQQDQRFNQWDLP